MSDALLAETVEVAERVHVTHRHDRYAAAILAEAQLAKIGDLRLDSVRSEHDRLQWRLAQNTLREAQRAARSQPQMASGLDAYQEKFTAYTALLDALEGDPEAHVRRAKAAFAKEDTVVPVGATVLLAGLLGGALAVSPLWAILPAVLLVAAVRWWQRTHLRSKRAQASVRAAWERARAYAEFMDDPQAGQWLRLVWRRHPLLLAQAPRPAKPKSGTIPIQKIAARAQQASQLG